MAFRDRFYTPKTAAAILSWRILLGIGTAGRPARRRSGLDDRSRGRRGGLRRFRARRDADAAPGGPASIRSRCRNRGDNSSMRRSSGDAARRHARWRHRRTGQGTGAISIGEKLDHGLDETWRIARRGHEIDQAVNRLDPTALALANSTRCSDGRRRSRRRASRSPAIESVESQLASVDRLKEQSTRTANTLRLTQTRLDELVARGRRGRRSAPATPTRTSTTSRTSSSNSKALRLAVEETRTA